MIFFAWTSTAVYINFNGYYFDDGKVLLKNSKINNTYLRYISTSEQRSVVIEEVLAGLQKYVKPGDFLFAYDSVPLLHFLTETKPYLFNSWPWAYSTGAFSTQLARAKNELGLPVILIQKFNTIGAFSVPSDKYLLPNQDRSFTFHPEQLEILLNFIESNHYQVAWSNEYFNIYCVENLHETK